MPLILVARAHSRREMRSRSPGTPGSLASEVPQPAYSDAVSDELPCGPMAIRRLLLSSCAVSTIALFLACSESDTSGPGTFAAGDGGLRLDGATQTQDSGTGTDAATTPTPDAGTPDADAGLVLPDGLLEPIPYTSRADNPFNGVAFPSYLHFEDWETDALVAPGVTPGAGYAVVSAGNPLTDSIDGDDGVVDGKCEKAGGCSSAFGNGTLGFTFDATVLGALPTHVGIAWTDGSTGCDAVFEAYDAADVLIGSKTAAAVGDNSISGTVAEDRYFGVVHGAGVKRIVVKSSAGGVEVDHLLFGR